MAEVYGDADARLERSVPIKVLPSHLSDYPNVKQRFGLYAKMISSLSRPQGEALRPTVTQAETRLRKLITSAAASRTCGDSGAPSLCAYFRAVTHILPMKKELEKQAACYQRGLG